MTKKLKIIIGIIIFLAILFLLQLKVQAKSYYIDDMEIHATILDNGNLEVEQTMEYVFNGSYNGIFINIPTIYENKDEIISKIENKIYNVQGVQLSSINVIEKGIKNTFKKVEKASNGMNGVYTEETR